MNPLSLTFPIQTTFVLTWTLTDADNSPINDATMTATLYAGRSPQNPTVVPGIAIAPINAIPLAYIAASAGQYSANIPATLGPLPNGIGYTLVIDANISGTPIYHQEVPVVIETAGSSIDLTTIDQVKAWIPGMTGDETSEDAVIQACITSWSSEFQWLTGMGNQNGDVQQSPFVSICDFNETHDGKGGSRLFPFNRPIRSVTAFNVKGIAVPQSTGFAVQGWVIDGTGRSISLRSGLGFWRGVQNINLQYSAGYSVTPADVTQAANIMVLQNYKRRKYLDEASRAMAGGAGTIRFRDWYMPPEVERVVQAYSRTL